MNLTSTGSWRLVERGLIRGGLNENRKIRIGNSNYGQSFKEFDCKDFDFREIGLELEGEIRSKDL